MISTIWLLAQQQTASPTAQPNLLTSLLPFAFMFVIFYFLLIRPQQKKQKDHQRLLSSLKTGDKVVTTSGIHGLIANVKETTVIVKVADNVKIEFDKSAIGGVAKSGETSKQVSTSTASSLPPAS